MHPWTSGRTSNPSRWPPGCFGVDSNADLHERMETLESNGDLIGYRSEPVDRDEIGIARAIASVRS